jgi:hypothetical protein
MTVFREENSDPAKKPENANVFLAHTIVKKKNEFYLAALRLKEFSASLLLPTFLPSIST